MTDEQLFTYLPPDDPGYERELELITIAQSIKAELPYDPPPPAALSYLSEKESPLPAKFESFRILEDGSSPQWDAICNVVAAFEDGAKVVFLEAPTGAGKTLIAETVRRLLETRGVFTCTSLSLQDQIERDFGQYAKVLKGRANYPTLDNPSVTADDCTKEKTTLPACTSCPGWTSKSSWGTSEGAQSHQSPGDEGESIADGDGTGIQGSWIEDTYYGDTDTDDTHEGMHCAFCHPVHACPYEQAKRKAITARMSVLNTAYLLTETNKVAKSGFRGHPFVIIDEADTLERQLMQFIEVEIGPKMRKQLGVGLPKLKTKDDAWVEWVRDEVIPALGKRIEELGQGQRSLDGLPDVEHMRTRRRLTRMLEDVGMLLEWDCDEEKYALNDGWVYTGYEDKKDEGNVTVTFKPVKADKYAQANLWEHAQRFLVMSATFLSAEDTAEQLGLEDDEWSFVEVNYSFDPMRRPVMPLMIGKVNNKNKWDMYPKMADEILNIMDDHPGVRILVHTNSYELTKAVYFDIRKQGAGYRNRAITYLNSNERTDALSRYRGKEDAVLFAPSFDRGIDLPDDECRVQVICKIPFGNLGDKQISTRAYGTGSAGKTWYQMEALRTLIQQSGRGMRHEEDYCRTYILDSAFGDMWRNYRRLFPPWWASAIVWDENDPKWKGLIG